MASAARPRGGSTKTRRPAAPREQAAEAPLPRTGAKRTVMYYIKQFPAYLRLLGGLMTDRRVSAVDKLLVGAAIAYIVMPVDIIPDFIPFLGEVDDLYLLVFALQRLISNTGRNVVYAHWTGAVEDLKDLNLQAALSAAAFFLPRRIRRRLRVIGR
jgi:uncharacterized membrane protein YkvA (DUF1232 family)